MTKSALLFEMISLLRRRPGMSVSELARALGRTERTIYRWLNELATDLQIPVFCSAGGYYILIPPDESKDDLTPEELLALKLSLRSSPVSGMSLVAQFAGSAWAKIKSAASTDALAKAGDLSHSNAITATSPLVPVPPDFSVGEHFKHSLEAWAGDDLVKVRVRFSPAVAELVAEVKRHPTQVTYPQPDGGIVFEVVVADTAELAHWVLSYGKEAEVLEPIELREHILEHARGILALYSDSQIISAPQM